MKIKTTVVWILPTCSALFFICETYECIWSLCHLWIIASLRTLCVQVHILDLKRQLETETNRHINTKELLKNAQKEAAMLKQQLNNTEAQLASQSSQRAPGKGKIYFYIEFMLKVTVWRTVKFIIHDNLELGGQYTK